MASASESPSVSPSPSPSASPSVSPSASPSRSPSPSPSVSPSPIPAGEVTYTIRKRARMGRIQVVFAAISFGSANDKYPDGGIPLTSASLGLRADPYAVVVMESSATGYMFEWDRSANTIRMLFPTVDGSGGSDVVGVELTKNVSAVASMTLELLVIGP